MVLIDIGSSTVKVYQVTTKELTLLETKSIHFKEDFDPAQGIADRNKEALISYIKSVKQKHKGPFKIYATAIFRKMHRPIQQRLIDEFFQVTGMYFNIVPHDLESYYLEIALAGKYTLTDPLLLMNIGGGSTELIITHQGTITDRYNLDLGVMTVVRDFPHINDKISAHPLSEVTAHIKRYLPKPPLLSPAACIYNGGELTYTKIAGYKLQSNTLVSDKDHPSMIKTVDFDKRNKEIFNNVTLAELERLMPNDPLWMHGARPCSAIAQAVCEHFGVKTIIPSDSNMVNGIVRQEFRQVVISGSFRKHLDYILDIKNRLFDRGVEILSPRFEKPNNPGDEFVVFDGEQGSTPLELERYHLDMINGADALIVCSPGGYVGASALIEIGYAHALGKRIIFTEKPSEFMLDTLPAEIGLAITY